MVRKPESAFRGSTATQPAARNARWTAAGDPRNIRFVRSEGLFEYTVAVRDGKERMMVRNSFRCGTGALIAGTEDGKTSGTATRAVNLALNSVPTGNQISGSGKRSILAEATVT